MEPQENLNQNQQSMLPRILLIGFFVVFIMIVLVLVFKKVKPTMVSENNTSVVTQAPVVPTVITKEGVVTLKTSDAAARYAKGATFSVDVTADSNGSDVVGYDLLVNFDKTKVDFLAVTSLSPDFKIFKLARSTGVTLSGTKQLSVKTPTIFTNSKIAILTFKSKMVATATVDIVSNEGKEVTEFVDGKSKIHHPQTNQISLEIF